MEDASASYSFIDHTADFGIRVVGSDGRSLFENAAGALWDLIAETNLVGDPVAMKLEITGWDYPDLMFNWLRELLFLWTGKAWLGKRVSIAALSETCLTARVWGEYYDSHRHRLVNDIKAVTYHQLSVEKPSAGVWVCQVIFDV